MARKRRPIPEGFAELAPRLTVVRALAVWHCTRRTAKKWENETGVRIGSLCAPNPPPCGHNRGVVRPPPEDFARVAPTINVERERAVWRARYGTLYRWERETGVNLIRVRGRRAAPPPPSTSAVKELGLASDTYRLAMGAWGKR